MSRLGWFGGVAPLSNELDHHAVLGPNSSIFEFGRGGGYESGSGGAVDPSSQLTYQAVSVSLNSSQETGALKKSVTGPRGGVTWGVPGSPDVPAVESGNGGERGGLGDLDQWQPTCTWIPTKHKLRNDSQSGFSD